MHSSKAILTLLGLVVSTMAVPVPSGAPGSNSLDILQPRGVDPEERSPREIIPESIKVSDSTATIGRQLKKKQICLGYNYGYGQCGDDSTEGEDSTGGEGSVAKMLA